MASVFSCNRKNDLFALLLLLRRWPYNVTLAHCSTALTSPLKEKSEGSQIPSLPVQPLEQMLQTYLKTVKPFVNTKEFQKTTELIKKFAENENAGKKLQKLLKERAEVTENWLSDWWLNTAYLEYRNPVVVYSSPGLVWPRVKFENLNDQLAHAAYVLHYALDFNSKIEKKEIKPEFMGGKQLCMSQYNNIFGTCRVPKMQRDELKLQDPYNPSDNIIVIYNNYLFSIPAFKDKMRVPMPATEYFALLLDIANQGKGDLGPAVGVLTTEHRDNWARSYEKLKQDPKNRKILEEYIEKALFVVCIDNPLCLGSGLSYINKCGKLLLHGFGYKGNAGNRWYDKTIQIIIGADGRGITYEHSPAEGGPIGVLTDHINTRMPTIAEVISLSKTNPQTTLRAQKLNFVLSDSLKEDIEAAGKAVDRLSDDLDVYCWSFTLFGKNKLKSYKVSPDSFIQIAIQFAFYGLHNQPAAQYESGTLRKYQFGRTDVIRTCLEEVVDFCRIMSSQNASTLEKHKALKQALGAHKSYALNVVNGCGVDRHLLALKILAKIHQIEDMKIFEDIAFQKSTYFQLSTSNVPVSCDGVMVYGPLVQDGYACCYNLRNDTINFGTSAWSTCRATYLEEFHNRLSEALKEMANLLEHSMPSKL